MQRNVSLLSAFLPNLKRIYEQCAVTALRPLVVPYHSPNARRLLTTCSLKPCHGINPTSLPLLSHTDYTVGWICALPVERAAALAMLDDQHATPPTPSHDSNNYSFGRIGYHNVVIASLPSGVMGTISAGRVAVQMLSTFRELRFGLMVGIGGGVPSQDHDIRLGDIVVSQPDGTYGGVIQYDFGKTVQGGKFVRTGSLNKPPEVLLTALATLQAKHLMEYHQVSKHISGMLASYPQMAMQYAFPGMDCDSLYEAEYDHPEGKPTCSHCEKTRLIFRKPRSRDGPSIHYGLIASGDQVMRHGATRERLRKDLNILCFEMEAAGLMEQYPCLVIRGICDYGDSHKIDRWQGYAAATAASYAKELLSVIPRTQIALTRAASEVALVDTASTTTAESFLVGFSPLELPQIDHFVARQEELHAIHSELSGNGGRRTVVLHGPGGIGKTQLAVAYTKLHKADYSAIFWLNSKDESSLRQSFLRAAKRILRKQPSPSRLSAVSEDSKLEEVVDAVKWWLDQPKNTRWLVIYDNYDNPALRGNTDATAVDLRRFLPEADHGSIIITTRLSRAYLGHRIKVGKLEDIRDSLDILSHASGRRNLVDDPDAVRLAQKLDGFPLALATAGAYLDQVATSFESYLRQYEESWAKLQQTSPRLESYEDRTLYSTWQLSFDQIKRQNELSANLLQLWAYFDNQDLWFELLDYGDADSPEWFSRLTHDDLTFIHAVRTLCDYGLVEVEKSFQKSEIESRGYSMHSCVHSWTIHVLNKEWDAGMAKTALECVASHVPDHEKHKYWVTQNRLMRHAARCWDMVVKGLVKEDNIEWVLHSLGVLYSEFEKRDEAEKIYLRVLEGKEKAVGRKYSETLDTVHNLGTLYADQGKLDEAEKMYNWALQGFEKALGREHISTLDTVNNLGNLYATQDKLIEAEKMYLRALEGKEKTLGREHPSTLNMINNLGTLYADQDKLDEAEKMYDRALQGYERAWGPEHISIFDTVNNLGALYKDQGKLDEAEKMYQRALQGKEKAWGREHTSTLDTVINLGALYKDQGKLDEAEKLYLRVLQGREKLLGQEHISTVNIVNNLGVHYKDQGKLDEAEMMFVRALQGYEKALGREHILTLDTVNNLGVLCVDQGKKEEAEKMYLRALEGKEKVLGREHPSTLETVYNLGNRYADRGKLNEAEEIYERALQGKEKVLGREHTSTLETIKNLGILYANQGKLDEAEKMYQRALQGYEKALGAEHTSTLDAVNDLGILHAEQGKLDKAEKMYQRALQGFEKAWGPEHTSTLSTVNNLGELYVKQGKLDEAENMYDRILQGHEKILGRE